MFSKYSCTYCDDIAEDLDHVIPHSYASSSGVRLYKKELVVPCCKECNGLLGDKLFFLIGERAAYLGDRYTKRYKKILDTPMWEKEEIEELGCSLKSMIQRGICLKEKVTKKLAHLEIISLIGPTIEDVWGEIKDKEDK
jgi:hypothetical protein|tara:strand:+ start:1944 stop:2360 length:417 start_codon:yes stop_codon:yes gene_type:complete